MKYNQKDSDITKEETNLAQRGCEALINLCSASSDYNQSIRVKYDTEREHNKRTVLPEMIEREEGGVVVRIFPSERFSNLSEVQIVFPKVDGITPNVNICTDGLLYKGKVIAYYTRPLEIVRANDNPSAEPTKVSYRSAEIAKGAQLVIPEDLELLEKGLEALKALNTK